MSSSGSWAVLGGPAPGTVSALVFDGQAGFFAGTRTGIYRGRIEGESAEVHWERLPSAPLEILSLGLSPRYAEDATLLAGTPQGLFLSRDGGNHWQAIHTPLPDPVILCLAFSPNFGNDGIVLAGTLEDGVYFSDSGGERWSYRGIGLLDSAVYSLAISPDFAQDETIFAGTESALYYSYNGARAWKQLPFPEEAAPILSLALSPHGHRDRVLYAGTESQGLHRSPDLGQTWARLDLPADSVNALVALPGDDRLLAATSAGLYTSDDGGRQWAVLLDRTDVLCVAGGETAIAAGLAGQGLWMAAGQADWRPCFTGPARALTGMALAPDFDSGCGRAYLYGPHEGIWQTHNGGRSWSSLNDNLPDLDIQSMAISPQSPDLVLAATGSGLLLSEDGGAHWTSPASAGVIGAAALVVFSPGGEFVAAASAQGEVWVATTPQGAWQRVAPPDGTAGRVLALAIDGGGRLTVVQLEGTGPWLQVWEGAEGRSTQRLRQPAGPNPLARLWMPPGDPERWYVSLDGQVWAFCRQSQDAGRIFEAPDGGKILALTGSQTGAGVVLFACTGDTLYRSNGSDGWTAVHDFSPEVAISLALSPAYPEHTTAYALWLGGSFSQGNLSFEEH